MECLMKGCGNVVLCRGLCQQHYLVAIRRVKQGHTSWNELIGLGLAKDTKRMKRGNTLIQFDTYLANRRVNGKEWTD